MVATIEKSPRDVGDGPQHIDSAHIPDSTAAQVFYRFPALPLEIRRKIWLEYIADAEVSPRVYRVAARCPKASSRVDHGGIDYAWGTRRHYYPKLSDQITLTLCALNEEFYCYHEQLMDSTFASRTAGSICLESRQVLLEVLPNTLDFKIFPERFSEPPQDPSHYKEHTLRFNGEKDIIVFDADWEDQEAVAEIVKLQGRPPESFHAMRNVGISYGAFEEGHLLIGSLLYYGVDERDCRCDTDECADCCKREPLSRFLACFPALKTFYIARIAKAGGVHDPCDTDDIQRGGYNWVKDATCHCPRDDGDGPKHVWPTVRGTDSNFERAVSFDERSGCPFPKLSYIERIRSLWRSQFPYYKALGHVDIRFLRRLDPNGKPNERYQRNLPFDRKSS